MGIYAMRDKEKYRWVVYTGGMTRAKSCLLFNSQENAIADAMKIFGDSITVFSDGKNQVAQSRKFF